jgi:hypothetical protein
MAPLGPRDIITTKDIPGSMSHKKFLGIVHNVSPVDGFKFIAYFTGR